MNQNREFLCDCFFTFSREQEFVHFQALRVSFCRYSFRSYIFFISLLKMDMVVTYKVEKLFMPHKKLDKKQVRILFGFMWCSYSVYLF